MKSLNPPKFVLLIILDGWGLATPSDGNAIDKAATPNMDRFWVNFPHTQLSASGESVGLPRSEPGNTETGHLNLGAGRIVYQDLERINMSIADGTFYQNPSFLAAIDHAKKNSSNLHLMGLIGAGGIHSNLEHTFALLELAKRNNFSHVFLHLFTDGRDSPPTSAKTYIGKLKDVIKTANLGTISTLMGRYWAMDRDLRWDRTQKTYLALTKSQGRVVKTPEEAIDKSYTEGRTDEFIEPSIITDASGKVSPPISDNDSVIFFNFRIDRPRQLTRAFIFKDFSQANQKLGFDPYLVKYQKKHIVDDRQDVQEPFVRGEALSNLFFVTMTEYEKATVLEGAHVAFPPEIVEIPIGRIISEAGYKQLRASESEKERFVTFYFNGQRNTPFDLEEKIIVPSPKVTTYDLKPEMSARELTSMVLEKLTQEPDIKFVVVNYANPDMVSHTGSIGATVKACEVVDECLGNLANFALAYEGLMLITADHGNAEEMINATTGEIDTEHNGNPVPFIVISKDFVGRSQTLQSGILADVAPTILSSLGISLPSSMTGRNLLVSMG
ncbi:MAG: 2,3-bisphosphoglycerate-independent phosphoglycerate mutase [Patescibacteria group bacterium]